MPKTIWITLGEVPEAQDLDLNGIFAKMGVRIFSCEPLNSNHIQSITYLVKVDGRQVLKCRDFLTNQGNKVKWGVTASGVISNGAFCSWPSKRAKRVSLPTTQATKSARFQRLRKRLEKGTRQ